MKYADWIRLISDVYNKAMNKERGKGYIKNAAQITLANVQAQMQGEAKKAGFETDDDVIVYINGLRKSK